MKRFVISSLAIATLLAAPRPVPAAAQTNPKPVKPRIEVCFVLDTTGSMSGLIEGAKQKIWSIANDIISAKPTPEIRIGLVAYRDRRDEYVTRFFDLNNDIDSVYSQLQTFRAGGGGDEPESVNQALLEAVQKMTWSADKSVLKIVFLVGDAPPHMDYANDIKYPEVCQQAVKKDLIINTVQCGNIPSTTPVWQEIAKLSEGSYMAIAQSGNMVAMSTPMDSELAALNRRLGTTLVAYGGDSARRSLAMKQAASEAAPAAVAADRLAFNRAYGMTVSGDGELLDALQSGKLKIESLKKDQLPPELQKLDEKQLQAALDNKQKERAEIQARIRKLSQDREQFLIEQRKRQVSGANADSFDEKVAQTIRTQAARKGIQYGQ
jgi:hypothetical protein